MIVRVWKVRIAEGMTQALETFANDVSLPMFRQQQGFLSVIFSRSDDVCATVILWDRAESIEALEASEEYQEVVRKIEESRILEGEHITEVFHAYGGFVTNDLGVMLSSSML